MPKQGAADNLKNGIRHGLKKVLPLCDHRLVTGSQMPMSPGEGG